MSDVSLGDGWWIASDGKWYAPELHPDYVANLPAAPEPTFADVPRFVPADDSARSPSSSSPPISSAEPAYDQRSHQPPGAYYDLEDAAGATAPSAHSNLTAPPAGRRTLVLTLAVTLLLVLLSLLAFRFFTSGSRGTGAESAEAAVVQLIDSINERDSIGFVEVFDPDEIEAWFASFAPALRSADNAAPVEDQKEFVEAYRALFSAFDYRITGRDGQRPTFAVQQLDTEGNIARVRVEDIDIALSVDEANEAAIIGGIGSSITGIKREVIAGTRLELRDSPTGLVSRLIRPGQTTEEATTTGAHLDLVAVKKDGGWYLSIGYSMLELARSQPNALQGNTDPDFGRAFAIVLIKAAARSPLSRQFKDSLPRWKHWTIAR